MFFTTIVDTIIDFTQNILFYWDKSDTERIKNIQRVRNRLLDCHDQTVVDSSKNHLLVYTQKGFYLISRRNTWKAQLTDEDITLYQKRGQRAFARIERRHKKNCA